MEAVEAAFPLYESVSEAISLGIAGSLRRRAIKWLETSRKSWTLDLGVGPGVSSRLLLADGFKVVVGLDPSLKLLLLTKSRIGEPFHPVVGVAETLPFRPEIFGGVLACFSLRDAADVVTSLREVSRVLDRKGRFALVDVGKPDGTLRRDFVWLYVRYAMPIVSRLLIGRRLHGNPFKMIIPTFQGLLTNGKIEFIVGENIGPAKLREFMLGGLVIVQAQRSIDQNPPVSPRESVVAM